MEYAKRNISNDFNMARQEENFKDGIAFIQMLKIISPALFNTKSIDSSKEVRFDTLKTGILALNTEFTESLDSIIENAKNNDENAIAFIHNILQSEYDKSTKLIAPSAEKYENCSQQQPIINPKYNLSEYSFKFLLRWLINFTADYFNDAAMVADINDLLNQTDTQMISLKLIDFLCSGKLYMFAVSRIFVNNCDSDEFMNVLISSGFLEYNSNACDSIKSMLKEKEPFYESVHAEIIQSIMTASMKEITVDRIVGHLKRYKSFDPFLLYPFDLEDALLIWCNQCILFFNQSKQYEFVDEIDDLISGLSDGKVFLVLFHIYFQTSINDGVLIKSEEILEGKCSELINLKPFWKSCELNASNTINKKHMKSIFMNFLDGIFQIIIEQNTNDCQTVTINEIQRQSNLCESVDLIPNDSTFQHQIEFNQIESLNEFTIIESVCYNMMTDCISETDSESKLYEGPKIQEIFESDDENDNNSQNNLSSMHHSVSQDKFEIEKNDIQLPAIISSISKSQPDSPKEIKLPNISNQRYETNQPKSPKIDANSNIIQFPTINNEICSNSINCNQFELGDDQRKYSDSDSNYDSDDNNDGTITVSSNWKNILASSSPIPDEIQFQESDFPIHEINTFSKNSKDEEDDPEKNLNQITKRKNQLQNQINNEVSEDEDNEDDEEDNEDWETDEETTLSQRQNSKLKISKTADEKESSEILKSTSPSTPIADSKEIFKQENVISVSISQNNQKTPMSSQDQLIIQSKEKNNEIFPKPPSKEGLVFYPLDEGKEPRSRNFSRHSVRISSGSTDRSKPHSVSTTPISRSSINRHEERKKVLIEEDSSKNQEAVLNNPEIEHQTPNSPAKKTKGRTIIPIPKQVLNSNKALIKNALIYVCLAGAVNQQIKIDVLRDLEASTSTHFILLFRQTNNFSFRGLYAYNQKSDTATKVYQEMLGPDSIDNSMVSEFYKFDSGARSFKPIPTKSFGKSVHAVAVSEFKMK